MTSPKGMTATHRSTTKPWSCYAFASWMNLWPVNRLRTPAKADSVALAVVLPPNCVQLTKFGVVTHDAVTL